MNKLEIFHSNQTSMCLDPHQNLRMRLVPLNMFKPTSIYTDRSKAALVLCFCHFPIWCLRSGVVLDSIDS